MVRKLRVVLPALVLSAGAFAATPAVAAQPGAALKALVGKLGGNPAQAASGRYSFLRKLDWGLQSLAAGVKPRSVGGVTLSSPAVVRDGRTLVDVYVSGDIDAAESRLRALGMDVQAVSRDLPDRMVEGLLPIDAATKVAALDSTKAVLSGARGYTNAGSVTTQGDAAQHGPQARALGATGAGVTVGVMSDSMNHVSGGIAASQLSGDLPAHVTDLGDDPSTDPEPEDEGRAMGEIIYDEAPGVTNMVFDTGTTGAADKASHIAALVSHGAKVIADDTFYPTEPMFQDGAVAQAVDAAKASGTAYVVSAGNRARESWEGTFTPGAGGLNDFGGGDSRQAVVDIPPGGSVNLALQWDEPWGGASDQFDVNVYLDNSLLGACPTAIVGSTVFPLTTCMITNSSGSTHELEFEIHRVSGTGTPKMKYLLVNNFGTFTIKEHATNSDTIDPDAASAAGSLAVAAVCWSTTSADCNPFGPPGLTSPEAFSSRGPVVHTRNAAGNLLPAPELRQKPNVAGADGVITSVPGFGHFFGTSAAAPSVAGVAAVVLSARPSLTVDQLYAIMTDPRDALDCASVAGVPDTDCGAGFIQADRAVLETHDTTGPSITPVLAPAAPDGTNGWYRSPVSIGWSVADPESAVVTENSCGTSVVTTDVGPTGMTCTASSIGGASGNSVSFKHDGTPPVIPGIAGIGAKTYSPASVPKSTALKCSSLDTTSGLASCAVTGFSSKAGSHKLTAVATNGAGATSSSTLTYKVGCVVPKLKGKTLAAAKKALKKAGCKVGKTKPKHVPTKYVVKSTSPRQGASKSANAKVNLTFRKKK